MHAGLRQTIIIIIIDPKENLAKAGAVREIVVTKHSMAHSTAGSVLWLKVDWFNMKQPYTDIPQDLFLCR